MVAASKPAQQLTPFGHALAGALGGVFSNAVVYPLDTVKTRIQAASSSAKDHKGKGKSPSSSQLSIVKLLFKIMREEGIFGFYKGFGASMLNTFSQQYAYFFFYSFVRNTYLKRLARTSPAGSKVPAISTIMELVLGALAGALAQIFTIPVAVIATRQQVGRTKKKSTYPPQAFQETIGKSQSVDDNESFFAVGKEIVREDGIGGLWLGIKPGLVLTVNPAITYGVFERVKGLALLGSTDTKLTPWHSFAVGAFSKTLATIVTYPYIMAKVRVQARATEDDDLDEVERGTSLATGQPKYKGALDVLAKVWQAQGFLGWYQGMGAQIIKAVLSQALLFMSKDQFERYAIVILTLWSRAIHSVQ
ncbi:adenine nucleotide transporter [Ramaria rubella]|nr:adenine nucleotide transporter [Ramaria rubella]